MDTTHMVSKRIEQALNQLQRELRREGQTLPTETFTVTTGDSITVEAASKAETQPRPAAQTETSAVRPSELLVYPQWEATARELMKSYDQENASASEFPSQESFDADDTDESGVRDE